VVALRAALDTWAPDQRATDSDMETLLLQALRDHGLPEPVLQHGVRDLTGALVGRADAAYPAHRIAIEYDSIQEHTDEFQLARDARRRNALQTLGYVVLSVRRSSLVTGGGEVCAQIASIMRRTALQTAEPA
jgi:very-short-patch-repair endonuclease